MPARDYIVRGDKREKILPDVSLGEIFFNRLKLHGNKIAITQKVSGCDVSVTYAELLRHAQNVAAILREHGVGSGDTVMLCCGNTLDFANVFLGTLFVGAALATVNPAFDTPDMVHMLDVIAPQLVICSPQSASSVQEALSQHVAVPCLTLEAVNTCRDTDVSDFSLQDVPHPDAHVALVMCSSGTSGRPKGVELTHAVMKRRLEAAMFLPNSEKQNVFLNISGPFWLSAPLVHLLSFLSGSKLVLLSPFQVDDFLEAVEKHQITYCLLGPDQLIALAQFPSADNLYDLSSLRTVICTGSPISDHMLHLAQKNIGRKIVNMYGLTEFMGMTPSMEDVGKPRNVGRPGANVELKISDLDSGASLGANMRGELRVRAATVFTRYRGNPTASAEAFDQDGFLRTGDVAYYDDDGYFYVVGRMKESFKYKNIHVDADDIEEVLLRHPDVLEATVVGVDHELDCAHATAFVVRRRGADVTEQHLVQLVAGELPSYKWLYGGVHFLPALPLTSTGKVRKLELATNYTSYINNMSQHS